MADELTLTERIEKAIAWIDQQIRDEYRRLYANRAYVGNQDYFERQRIKPLMALRRLIRDMQEQLK